MIKAEWGKCADPWLAGRMVLFGLAATGNERTLCKSDLHYALRGKPSIPAMSIGGAALSHGVLMHGCARYGRYGWTVVGIEAGSRTCCGARPGSSWHGGWGVGARLTGVPRRSHP